MRFGDGSLHPQPHEGGKNYAFLDGHVKHAKQKEVTSLWMGLVVTPKLVDGYEAETPDYRSPFRTGAIRW